MGYYAYFEFDLTISPKNVVAAEEIVRRHYAGWSSRSDYTPDLAEMFNDMWGDSLAEEQAPAPLQALASGEVRGKVVIGGGVDKKWRDWEEPLLDELAPLIDEGGEIEVKGEDFDAPSVWVFDGAVRHDYPREPVRCDYLRELEEKAKSLEKAEALIREMYEYSLRAPGSLFAATYALELKDYLHPPALQALAKQAE